MQKLDTLRSRVEELYTSGHPAADIWNDWGYPNHVLYVANLTERIAVAQHANVELAIAGALLHDIADAVMDRKSPGHEAKSLAMAKEILEQSGFSATETDFVVNEIVKPHSCNELKPDALEGKVMATADGAAHLLTDFYWVFCWRHYGPNKNSYEAYKEWVRIKIEKNFHTKIFFDDIKQEAEPYYKALKLFFA